MGTNNAPCYAPYGEARPSFKRGLEGFTNASATPIHDLFDILKKNDMELVIIGDSTMRQKIQVLKYTKIFLNVVLPVSYILLGTRLPDK